ncbi:glycoside hydrolase family 99-like domain-containing protein [Flavobacterium flavigenum]|uniref:glycoside hydrolase family 99-like domain-containing protein n=1 Tax=Flavobacterium flavigenum TaxID=3003258 RepID=UPI002482A875|nr:glycoside hydrolase family 99-like domain-containing protein [Flavobacterium flavigenum]
MKVQFYKACISFFLIIFTMFYARAQAEVKLGAYYFDGWHGTYPYHLTSKLKDSFSNREPKWGWMTSSQSIMNKQIETASKAGISFFSFCWYYPDKGDFKKEPLNNSLKYFIKSPVTQKMSFSLMVANHAGFLINKNNWSVVSKEWLSYFSVKNYMKVNNKPLLIFFSIHTLVEGFGSAKAVKDALATISSDAEKRGLGGVSAAVCIDGSPDNIALAELCGFDIITGYNYHNIALPNTKIQVPISKLQTAEIELWENIRRTSKKLPYIPVCTLNWDPRPWANTSNNYENASYYVGFSPNSVKKSISNCVQWLSKNPIGTEKIGLIYAWNEYGEGAFLTPTKKGVNYLKDIKNAKGKK